MNRTHQQNKAAHKYPDRVKQMQDISLEADDLPGIEGVHMGVILTDSFGNEWDDTGDFGELDFRLVDDL